MTRDSSSSSTTNASRRFSSSAGARDTNGFFRSCHAALLGLAFALVLFGGAEAHAPFPDIEGIEEFIMSAPVPDTVRLRLVSRLGEGRDVKAVLLEESGIVYSMAWNDTASDGDPAVRRRLEKAALGTADLRAKRNLLLFAAGDRYPREQYSNREAVANALLQLMVDRNESGVLLPGLQTRGGILQGAAVVLAFISEGALRIGDAVLPGGKLFNDAYCSELYPTARSFLDSRDYERALMVLQEMHRLGWAPPDASLDAVECFLRLGRKKDGERLLRALSERYVMTLSSVQLERMADFFVECGDASRAGTFYRLALEKFREERSAPEGVEAEGEGVFRP